MTASGYAVLHSAALAETEEVFCFFEVLTLTASALADALVMFS